MNNQNQNSDMKYRIYTGPSEAHKAYNSLKGIIDGISIDEKINEREVAELAAWCEKHEYLSSQNPFYDLITNVQVIISDNEVTIEEIEDMKWLCEKLEGGFSYYDVFTSDLQQLQGICHGILADGRVKDEEVVQLNNWLAEHNHLSSYYPYDEITSLVTEVISDGVIDDDERKLLKRYFNEFVTLTDAQLQEQITEDTESVQIGGICSIAPELQFKDKNFCFTGRSSRGSRSEIESTVVELEGIFQRGVTMKTDYLIVGDDGNPCWAYSCYGRKVEKAINLRKQGVKVVIIHEADFWDEAENYI